MKKILIVEDNIDIRENLAEILTLAGYEAHTAENGKTGIEKAEQILPDLIICDVMMPVLDGYATLKILNSKPKTANIPFIFLTAKAQNVDFRYGMNLGADDYVTKPFETNELLQVVEMRLQKAEKLNLASVDMGAFVNETLGATAFKDLAQERETRLLGKKDPIYTEGSLPRYFYFIKSGKVKISKQNDDGKELILSVLDKDDFFGHTDLLNGGKYTESAIMLDAGELALIQKDDFFKLVFQNRDVANRFIKLLAGKIAEQEQYLLNLAYNSVRKRVADALCRLYEHYGNAPISLLRDDLAALAGTAKETAIRTLTDFREEKLIAVDDGKIQILELNKLKNLVN